jgi:peptide alpha-N-acetyltransferase
MAPTNDSNPQAGQGRPLPKKESDLFKNVVKHYEMKQYKKAVKQADTILKKFPNHGETLAMKGLVMNCLSKRDEAHELVKLGLMNDMRWVRNVISRHFVVFGGGNMVNSTHFFPASFS